MAAAGKEIIFYEEFLDVEILRFKVIDKQSNTSKYNNNITQIKFV